MCKILKKILNLFFILYILFGLLYDIDVSLAKGRAKFISERIEHYRVNNNEILYRLSDMDKTFEPSDRYSESYCDFWDKNIDGIGYCFYTYNGSSKYYILIYSLFNRITYSSENKAFIKGDGFN
ncbi:hypothetical protein ACWIUH_10280 [Ursidibacter arcticus]